MLHTYYNNPYNDRLVFSVTSGICVKHLFQAWSNWRGWVSHSCLLLSSCHWSVSHKEISWRLCVQSESMRERDTVNGTFTKAEGNRCPTVTVIHKQAPTSLQTYEDKLNTLIGTDCFWAAETRFLERGGCAILRGSRMNVGTQTNRFRTWSSCRVGKESSFTWQPVDILSC